jgi:hypothetical protein
MDTSSTSLRSALLFIASICLFVSGQNHPQPSIEFTAVPSPTSGRPGDLEATEGRVNGASHWKATTHLGALMRLWLSIQDIVRPCG